MTLSMLLGLLQNTAILLAFSMLYDNLWINRGKRLTLFSKVLIGLLIGGIGIILMLTPWTLVPGLVFDTRSIMLSIAGLFFGFIPTVIAIIVDVCYRWYLGGQGVYMGVNTIIISGLIGILWHKYRFGRLEKHKNSELLMLGLVVHFVMLLGAFLLPLSLAIQTVKTIALPLVLVYVPATVLLGRLMYKQYDNWLIKVAREQLLESEQKLNHELLAAKEKAEESDRLKMAFLANLSHEIRTPLNGILGFADILKNPVMSSEEIREYLTLIRISGVRMLEIMQNLIDISKLDSGTMSLHRSNVNLNERLDNLYYLFLGEVTEKGLDLHYKKALPGDDAILYCDEEKINTIFSNLIKNAIKFSEKGKIEFGYIKNEEGLIEFYVSDEGIGIPDERREFVFQRFAQNETEKMFREGTGLGLSVAKSFVEMMGGKIWINSFSGKGAEVRFTIPSSS
ncbi:MAG TPA: LytS/YhcK type 5TM receptor domain-containing protein [Lentimicrobium sp.]|nr:LytS/YhcK type 5TM receptor domain-containing protein [Lentimicrobium sp.]